VVFTQGCNFRCPYCHNPELVLPFGELMDEGGVLAFLGTRARYLDGVVLSGGEPTLIPDLDDFARRLKGLGFLVKLDTNGSRPGAVQSLVERRLVDYVALDLKADPSAYPPELAPPGESGAVMETVNLLKRLPCPHEFRTTCASPFVNEESVEAIARAATGDSPLYLQELRTERVFNPVFMERHPDQPGPARIEEFRKIARRWLPCRIR
jgi:pyruvate formate lyase activating enzyme